MAPDRVIVTGSTGFVGQSVVAQLDAPCTALHFGAADWRQQLDAAEFAQATVLHLAARTHDRGSLEDFRRDNVEKTRALAARAAAQGARRLVYLSTIKVNGEETRGRPFDADDVPAPQDAYGETKRDAEEAIAEAASRSGLEFAIVRAPLIYGAGVRGNLLALLRLVDSPLPLPFGAIDNRRSFLHVDDLARLILACARLPHAAGHVYLGAHRDSISTRRLVTLMRERLERPARVFPVPRAMLEAAAALAGQGARIRRLTRSLEADPSRAERELDWFAQISFETAVEDMVTAYRAEPA